MRNTTIVIDEKTLKDARLHAARLGCSSSAWVNKLTENAMRRSPEKSMRELLELADKCAGNSRGKRWTRDAICER
jgi:hypothetical protein